MKRILFPAVIVSSVLGSSAAWSTNLITGADTSTYNGTFSNGTLTTGRAFVSLPFQFDVTKNYRLTYATSSSGRGTIAIVSVSNGMPAGGSYVLLNNSNYSTNTSYTFGPSDLVGFVAPTSYLSVFGNTSETFTNFLLEAFSLGPDAANTTLAMIANQNAVRSLLSQRSSAIMTMMDYDCDTFDAKGYCVSFRARYTAMESQNEGAGVLTAAYRASEKVRIGGFIDYRASEKDSTGLKQGDTMPTIGAFAAYSQSGNATGFQAKASAAYNSGKVTVTRAGSVADNTEAGSGKASLNSYAIGAELAWGFAVSPTMLATPYAGLRYSDVTRKGYTEGTVTGSVEFPISYDAYYQRQTSATAGVRLTGMFTDKVGYQAALGGEYDLAHKANAYSGTSTIPDLETFALANSGSSNRARVVASTGLYYQMDKTQRLTANVGVRGQAYSSQPSVTTLVGYQVAF